MYWIISLKISHQTSAKMLIHYASPTQCFLFNILRRLMKESLKIITLLFSLCNIVFYKKRKHWKHDRKFLISRLENEHSKKQLWKPCTLKNDDWACQFCYCFTKYGEMHICSCKLSGCFRRSSQHQSEIWEHKKL